MFMKQNDPRGLFVPAWGAIYMYMNIIFKHPLLQNCLANQCQISYGEGGTKVCINGPGHMTKMAVMLIYDNNL